MCQCAQHQREVQVDWLIGWLIGVPFSVLTSSKSEIFRKSRTMARQKKRVECHAIFLCRKIRREASEISSETKEPCVVLSAPPSSREDYSLL